MFQVSDRVHTALCIGGWGLVGNRRPLPVPRCPRPRPRAGCSCYVTGLSSDVTISSTGVPSIVSSGAACQCDVRGEEWAVGPPVSRGGATTLIGT